MTTTKEKTVMPAPPAWTTQEPENEYHARSKFGEIMSSGMLKKFRNCPFAYRQTVLGNIKEKDSTAYRFGRAVHKIILEGDKAFNKAFAADGPINPSTGKMYGVGTKKHDEWLAANGYTRDQVITEDELDTLITMANMTRRHAEAYSYLEYGWPELVARADLHGIPCQIRMDWLTHDANGNFVIIDLKTTEDITWFESDANRYGYPHQFAFYRDVAQELLGVPVNVAAIVVEKKEPFRVGIFRMPVEVLDLYSAENRIALEQFKQCQMEDNWPTGYEDARDFSLPRNKLGA